MNPPVPDDCPESGPAGAMPTPTSDAADTPGIIDQRNALLAALGTLYGLMLFACGLVLWAHGYIGQSEIGFITTLSVGYPLYFLPTLIICFVRHRRASEIFVLNVSTGWTVIGWLLAFLWAIRPMWQRRRESTPK